jgi:phosphatidylinositol 4-kinase
VVCLIHAFAPRWGIWLSNGFGAFKLVLLSLLVFTGFAALAGTMAVPKPNNFSNFHGPSTDQTFRGSPGGYALALLQVLYSYSGWENANYVGLFLSFCFFEGRGVLMAC